MRALAVHGDGPVLFWCSVGGCAGLIPLLLSLRGSNTPFARAGGRPRERSCSARPQLSQYSWNLCPEGVVCLT